MNNTYPLKTKILLSIISLLFFLFLTEIGLRLTGHLYLRTNIQSMGIRDEEMLSLESKNVTKSLKTKKVLCLGDSYTYGGLGDYSQTYPYHLQNIFNQNQEKNTFHIINGGVCEFNSRQVLAFLPSISHRTKPDVIILLVGASNKFNFALFDFKDNPIKAFIRSLRLYKIWKITLLNFKNQFLSPRNLFLENGYPKKKNRADLFESYIRENSHITETRKDDTNHDKIWYYLNKEEFNKAITICKDTIKDNPNKIKLRGLLAYSYLKAQNYPYMENIIEPLFKQYPSNEFVLTLRSYLYEAAVIQESKAINNPKLVEYIIRSIESDPYYGKPQYTMLTYLFPFQSQYNAHDILTFFDKIAASNKNIEQSYLFKKHYNYFRKIQSNENKISNWLYSDLIKIAKFCKDEDITLIIQNYPYPQTLANNNLQKVATKYSLPFINQLDYFQKLLKNYSTEELFHDDLHCTDKGHELMAGHIYEFLTKHYQLKKEKNEKK